jgi:hypothetical protein
MFVRQRIAVDRACPGRQPARRPQLKREPLGGLHPVRNRSMPTHLLHRPLQYVPSAWQVAVALAALGAACQDPLTPSTQWLVGSWQWLGECCGEAGFSPADAPNACILTLAGSGSAIERDYDLVVVRTQFRVARDAPWLTLRFDTPILRAPAAPNPAVATEFRVTGIPPDHLTLTPIPQHYDGQSWVFVRIPDVDRVAQPPNKRLELPGAAK